MHMKAFVNRMCSHSLSNYLHISFVLFCVS